MPQSGSEGCKNKNVGQVPLTPTLSPNSGGEGKVTYYCAKSYSVCCA
jgi:hypothetical protein